MGGERGGWVVRGGVDGLRQVNVAMMRRYAMLPMI